MLYCLRKHLDCKVHATDGFIGEVVDFYFDDSLWVLRYLVLDIGTFVHGRKVLISPVAVAGFDATSRIVLLQHSIEEIKNSPDIDLDKPVYRQLEEQLVNYYSWVTHWVPQADLPEPEAQPAPTGDSHLRSMNNVCKYEVMGYDGRIGSISDFVMDNNEWQLPLIILNVSHYLAVGDVVLTSAHIKGIRVEDREVSLDLYREDAANAPQFDPERPLEEYLETAP